MRAVTILGLALCVPVGAVAAPRPKEVAPKGTDVTGRWTLVSLNKGGERVPVHDMAVDTEFTADGWRVNRNRLEQVVAKFRYVLDRAKDPPTLDLRSETADSVVVRGIYKVDGDTLTVCYVTDSETPRPDKLEAPDGSKVWLAIYHRTKDK